MAGKASLPKTPIDDTVSLNKARKKQFGRERAAYAKVQTGAGPIGVSFAGTGNNINTANPVLTSGGTPMIGPLAFHPKAIMISSDTIDISRATGTGFSSRVSITGQTTADDLKQIDGANNAGQILFLQSITGQTITLKHHTGSSGGGNINIPGGADYVMGAQDIVLLQWDTIHQAYSGSGGQWTLVSSSSSSSGATRELDNLQNTAVNADIIPASASSVDLGSLTKPYDVTYSDEVVFVTEGAISHTKPTIGWGNSARGMTFSMPSLGSTQNAWTWEEAASVKMSLTNGGLLTVGTMLSTSLLRAEGDTELGNATSDDLTITARVDSDIIPKTTQSHDLGDTDRWWDKTYSMYVYTNRVTLSGSNAQIDMGNYPINNCGDIDFDGTEDIKRSGTTMLTFGSSAITTGDYKDLVLGSAAYLQVSATSSTAPSGAFDGYFYVKNTSGSFVKVPYYTP